MFKTIIATAAAFLVLPAVAHAGEARQFSHEGVDYSYSTTQKGNSTVIDGRTSLGVPFHLFVRGERVTGTYDSHYVSFTKADVARQFNLPAN